MNPDFTVEDGLSWLLMTHALSALDMDLGDAMRHVPWLTTGISGIAGACRHITTVMEAREAELTGRDRAEVAATHRRVTAAMIDTCAAVRRAPRLVPSELISAFGRHLDAAVCWTDPDPDLDIGEVFEGFAHLAMKISLDGVRSGPIPGVPGPEAGQ
ncbi:hypothetical protein CSPHI_04930 [Corynebacterium sphenisci DSM 44792]|uniref:Uncharacterized protein n=1 Tax=Corynebacterium sphenisci DSM 44792 TaxID=1437874 RepID=A0A1L7CX90_9CORY|nr:hypothetical protein [Corynebacterium sphenisci]APT90489.1 hypothetical protein CSPHI_04930 [Corynebacterium sphenisci DSM 44792]